MWDLKPFRIYTLCSQEKNYGFSMWDKKFFSLNILGVIILSSVWFLLKTNNQTKLKKKKLKPNRNRFKSIGFGSIQFFRTKIGLARFFCLARVFFRLGFGSVFSVSSL